MKTYTITVSDEHMQLIWNTLLQLPFGQVAPLMGSLDHQLSEQNKAAAEQKTDVDKV